MSFLSSWRRIVFLLALTFGLFNLIKFMHTRGKAITRLAITRMRNDQNLDSIDKSTWYNVNESSLTDELAASFVQLSFDEDTSEFLESSARLSDSVCLQMWYNIMSSILGMMMTKTSINGILNRGQMFVFSRSQLETFLGSAFTQTGSLWASRSLLDLGAGDGAVTSELAQFFRGPTYVTEPSTPMQYRLRQRGYTILDIDKWQHMAPECGLISALNLLDRHPEPRRLLADLHAAAIQNDVRVLLAFVLPFTQYSEFTRDGVHEYIRPQGRHYEEQLAEVYEHVIRPSGFTIERWTKLPYLCRGDLTQSYYVLGDVLMLLKAVPGAVRHGYSDDSAMPSGSSYVKEL